LWYFPPFFFGRLVPQNESKKISPKFNGLCFRHGSKKHVFSFSTHSTQIWFLFCYIEMNYEACISPWWWHSTGKPFWLMTTGRTQLQSPQLSYFCDKIFVQLQNGSRFWRKGWAWKSFFHNNFYLFGIKKRLIFILVQTKRKRAPILSTDLAFFTFLLWQQK